MDRVRRTAGALVGLQGLGLVAVSVWFGVTVLAGDQHDRLLAEVAAAVGVLAGALLVWCGRGIDRAVRVAVSPVVITEVIAVPVGIGLLQGGRLPAGLLVLVPALVVLALLFGTPAGRETFALPEDR